MTGTPPPVAGAIYESLRPCALEHRPTRLMITDPGPSESVVVDAYTGRRPRTIPSARLHEATYDPARRRYARSGYVRAEASRHLADVVRAALTARRIPDDLVNGASFSSDPVLGGTLTLVCQPDHPAVQASMAALAAIGRSAAVIPDRDPRTVLRVRYGPGGALCPVRWMTRDDWTMHYCGKPLGHADGEHEEPRTYELLLDGDDDGLDWPGHRPPAPPDAGPARALARSQACLAVTDDSVLDPDEAGRVPGFRQHFTVQLRTTALRRAQRPDLMTYGPLDQEEAKAPVASVTDGAGRPWRRRASGAWSQAGSGREPDAVLPWHLLAFRHAPLTCWPADRAGGMG